MATAFQNQQHPGLAHAREWTLMKVGATFSFLSAFQLSHAKGILLSSSPLSAAPLAFTLHRHKGVLRVQAQGHRGQEDRPKGVKAMQVDAPPKLH
ncbi:hypothetical protein CDEST_08531 [Colletotrichum destructivum]|uniref:Uncharacterized protein n=1 Tax=Colletotrichum destructivum TaxID=34406 RepID=A0AAX4IJC7_9PEZI|nr:hypothetical protein CDEST_08531 [Colletotrichum destructivum]